MNRGAWQSDGDLTRTLLAVATYLYQSNISSVQFPYTKSLVKPRLNQPGFYSTDRALSFGIKSSSFPLPPKLYTLQVEKQTANPSILYLTPLYLIVFTSVIAQKVPKCLEYFESLSPWFLVVLGSYLKLKIMTLAIETCCNWLGSKAEGTKTKELFLRFSTEWYFIFPKPRGQVLSLIYRNWSIEFCYVLYFPWLYNQQVSVLNLFEMSKKYSQTGPLKSVIDQARPHTIANPEQQLTNPPPPTACDVWSPPPYQSRARTR